ncbi:MAG: hypothetical protein ACLUNO_01260 [Oscillospiraceae bacterium]
MRSAGRECPAELFARKSAARPGSGLFLTFSSFVFLPGERRVGRAGLGLGLAAADVVDDQDHGAEQRRHEIADEHGSAAGHVAADDAHDHADDAENDEENTHELRSRHGEASFSD